MKKLMINNGYYLLGFIASLLVNISKYNPILIGAIFGIIITICTKLEEKYK